MSFHNKSFKCSTRFVTADLLSKEKGLIQDASTTQRPWHKAKQTKKLHRRAKSRTSARPRNPSSIGIDCFFLSTSFSILSMSRSRITQPTVSTKPRARAIRAAEVRYKFPRGLRMFTSKR